MLVNRMESCRICYAYNTSDVNLSNKTTFNNTLLHISLFYVWAHDFTVTDPDPLDKDQGSDVHVFVSQRQKVPSL